MGLLEKLNFTLPPVDVLGSVPQSMVVKYDRVVGTPTSGGPPGPLPIVTGQSVWYGGALTNGNYFGICEVTVAGSFQKDEVYEVPPPAPVPSSTWYPWAGVFGSLARLFGPPAPEYKHRWVDGSYIASATLEVRPPHPPVFAPDPVTIPKGSPGPKTYLRVQVTPAGPYEIVLSIKDPEQRAGMFVPTIVRTGNDGMETFYIEDIANAARRNIVVTATISSQMPCSAPDVVSTFTVDVV
jgi:hypothetical protein